MAVSARRNGLSVTVFTLGGDSYICELENATVSIEVESEDVAGVCDVWGYEWPLTKSWSLECTCWVAGSGATMLKDAADGDAQVAVSFTTGGNAYTGVALITSASHEISRKGHQKWSVTLKGQGALTVTTP